MLGHLLPPFPSFTFARALGTRPTHQGPGGSARPQQGGESTSWERSVIGLRDALSCRC